MNSWLRLYRDVCVNPKVQKLNDCSFRFWVNCLCLSDDQGMLPNIDDLSWSQRIKKHKAEALLTDLVDSGLIDCLDSGYRMHNWASRQFHADVSTQRVKRFRERHAKRDETVLGNAPRTDTDTETDTETFHSGSEIASAVDNYPPGVAPAALPKASANAPPSALEPSLTPLLDELAEIYRRAGAPIAAKHRQLATELLGAIPPEKRARVPNYCKWALVSGKWPNPAKTKSLLNVLRDGDWDVEITQRILPATQNETPRDRAGREATERYLRSKGVA